MAGRGGITYEPCTLVYTLIDDNVIDFEDFCLLVRSLHTFMVDSITPNQQMNNVHVKLNYQASIANAIAKLGDLQHSVAVTKLSAFVKESEFSRLADIQRRFNITPSAPDEQPPATKSRKPRQQRPVFPARPAPYQKAKASTSRGGIQPLRTAETYTEDEVIDLYPGHDSTNIE